MGKLGKGEMNSKSEIGIHSFYFSAFLFQICSIYRSTQRLEGSLVMKIGSFIYNFIRPILFSLTHLPSSTSSGYHSCCNIVADLNTLNVCIGNGNRIRILEIHIFAS